MLSRFSFEEPLPAFQPIYPAHSIEQCSIAFVFSQALPDKALSRITASIGPAFRNAGLEPLQAQGFQVNFATGSVSPVDKSAPSQYVSADRGTALRLMPNTVALTTGRYVRWSPFAGQIEQIVLPAVVEYAQNVDLIAVQLEYLDTFIWEGSWEDFNWRELLRTDSGFIVEAASRGSQQWHSHAGWFDFVDRSIRFLQKVDIDIVERLTPTGPRPAINILTTLKQEIFAQVGQPVTGSIPIDGINDLLESLHKRLKDIFATIITEQAAGRVGLT